MKLRGKMHVPKYKVNTDTKIVRLGDMMSKAVSIVLRLACSPWFICHTSAHLCEIKTPKFLLLFFTYSLSYVPICSHLIFTTSFLESGCYYYLTDNTMLDSKTQVKWPDQGYLAERWEPVYTLPFINVHTMGSILSTHCLAQEKSFHMLPNAVFITLTTV